MSCDRLAPMAARIAISRPRVLPRASTSNARFTQAMSSTQTTAPKRTRMPLRISGSKRASLSVRAFTPQPRRNGSGPADVAASMRGPRRAVSFLACSTVMPGFSLPTCCQEKEKGSPSSRAESVWAGTHTSAGPLRLWKDGGRTPTTVYFLRPSVMVLPRMRRSPP